MAGTTAGSSGNNRTDIASLELQLTELKEQLIESYLKAIAAQQKDIDSLNKQNKDILGKLKAAAQKFSNAEKKAKLSATAANKKSLLAAKTALTKLEKDATTQSSQLDSSKQTLLELKADLAAKKDAFKEEKALLRELKKQAPRAAKTAATATEKPAPVKRTVSASDTSAKKPGTKPARPAGKKPAASKKTTVSTVAKTKPKRSKPVAVELPPIPPRKLPELGAGMVRSLFDPLD